MASPIQRKAAIRKARQRAARRRMYMLAGLALLIIVGGIGVYLYVTGQSSNNPTSNPDIVYAKINTTKGLIEIELYQSKTPKTVTNFVNLAGQGFFDGLVFHRIGLSNPSIPPIIQTGDPYTRDQPNSTWGKGQGPTKVPLEPDPSLHNNAGYVAMARVGNDTNSGTSQFYINMGDNTSLDGQYTVFGRVIVGMDVATLIQKVPTYYGSGQPIDPSSVKMISVTISNTA
ncbi:peptidylprolyl isomerase [Candidatus Bathyarchaeota archaeon]|nr:MAG: peptidylprolyl isomerase [Candidatus Bathyarchaeota archaeon]